MLILIIGPFGVLENSAKLELMLTFFAFFALKNIILDFSPFQKFIRYLQYKNWFTIPRPISSTTKNFRTIGWIVLSRRTNELMAKPDFDGRENAELCIIWTFYCPYLASKWSYSCTQNDPNDNTLLMMYLKTLYLKYSSCYLKNTDVRRVNAKLCIIWTFYCPYLASKLSPLAIFVIKITTITTVYLSSTMSCK